MPATAKHLSPELTAKLSTLDFQDLSAIPKEQMHEIVQTILDVLAGRQDTYDVRLQTEVQFLANFIHESKKEIAALRPADIQSDCIPDATDELDAIVAATAEATGTILDAAEAIESVAEGLDAERAATLSKAVTSIYEACGFQDITGQRISKVIKVLKEIEGKVDGLLKTFGPLPDVEKVTQPPTDADLMNGPQLKGVGNDQSDIDSLFD